MEEINPQALEEFMVNSGSMYSFLARLYRTEVDQELLDQMAKMEFETDSEMPEMNEGYRLLRSFLDNMGPTTKTDLAVDYTRIFLGLGPRQGEGAFPYESVYTSTRGLLMQAAMEQVMDLYQQEGLVIDENFIEPGDHIALELVFMEYLCQKTMESLQAGNEEAIDAYLKKQQDFLGQHLLRWVPKFSKDVQRFAATDFYKAAAQITQEYLEIQQELLSELV